MGANQHHHNFLIVTYPAQGHINPALHLANRLARNTTGHRITFSTAVSAHCKMFPNLASPNQEFHDGLIAYVPFSDGYDEGFNKDVHDIRTFISQFKRNGSSTLSSIIDDLDSRGQCVTCVIYTFFVPWAAEIADCHRIPSVQYFIQPATVFAIYYHYFHGYDKLIAKHSVNLSSVIELPGLQPMQLCELPSFLVTSTTPDHPYSVILNTVKEAFVTIDRTQSSTSTKKPKVLVNTFDELEPKALGAVDDLDLIAVGPILSSFPKETSSTLPSSFDLFKPDGKEYIEWLDSKPEKSVVYVSFGSMSVVKKQQMEEISKGLKASGRPYLWVVRKDSRYEGVKLEDNGESGMVVEWCSQMRVLSHPSVGCFVTHCGWNSILESLICKMPTVGVPQWTDQWTNAMLIEKEWGTGVRGEVNEEGVLEGGELERCLDLAMGEREKGAEIRRRSESWMTKAKEAVLEGGSSDRNLRAFVDEIPEFDH